MSKGAPPRKPRVFKPDDPSVVASEAPHDFEDDGISGRQARGSMESSTGDEDLGLSGDDGFSPSEAPAGVTPARRGLIGWGSLLVSAAVGLAVLAAGVWFTRFVSVAVWRDDALGWIAKGLFGVIALTAIVLIGREVVGLFRLSRLRALRRQADEAYTRKDAKLEQRVVREVAARARARADLKWDFDRFKEEERHMRETGELLGLADRVLMARPDAHAKQIVFQSARRVGVVTTVVPIALIVVLFVLFENLRMVRRLAGAYGGRPGFFGGVRLLGWIISHIAATGAIALTDDLFGQFFGQDMLRRVSRKLGEGAFNGAMTARLGVAALDVIRPIPFVEAKKPRARHIFYQAFPEMRPTELVKRAVGIRGKDKPASDA